MLSAKNRNSRRSPRIFSDRIEFSVQLSRKIKSNRLTIRFLISFSIESDCLWRNSLPISLFTSKRLVIRIFFQISYFRREKRADWNKILFKANNNKYRFVEFDCKSEMTRIILECLKYRQIWSKSNIKNYELVGRVNSTPRFFKLSTNYEDIVNRCRYKWDTVGALAKK